MIVNTWTLSLGFDSRVRRVRRFTRHECLRRCEHPITTDLIWKIDFIGEYPKASVGMYRDVSDPRVVITLSAVGLTLWHTPLFEEMCRVLTLSTPVVWRRCCENSLLFYTSKKCYCTNSTAIKQIGRRFIVTWSCDLCLHSFFFDTVCLFFEFTLEQFWLSWIQILNIKKWKYLWSDKWIVVTFQPCYVPQFGRPWDLITGRGRHFRPHLEPVTAYSLLLLCRHSRETGRTRAWI